MENSRHERAIIVAASYIIGFTSAFIAYGVHQAETTSNLIVTTTNNNYQSVASVQVPARSYEASVRIESDGLVVASNGKERLLSARKASPLMASVVSAGSLPGFAEKIIEAELSRDSEYVYFCEQLALTSSTCDAYVYDIASDVLHPVMVDGEHYSPEIDTHTSAWSPTGYLNIGGYMSASINSPWVLQ